MYSYFSRLRGFSFPAPYLFIGTIAYQAYIDRRTGKVH